MRNENCPHDGDKTFAFVDFNDLNWKWHCDACRSTLSGPRPNLTQVRAAIEALTLQAEKFLQHAETCTGTLRETFVRFHLHQNRLIDGLRWEMREGALVDEYEAEQRAERARLHDEAMIEEMEMRS